MAYTRRTKHRVENKCLILEQMRQIDLAPAQHLLSPFSSPLYRVKFLSGYGLCIPNFSINVG